MYVLNQFLNMNVEPLFFHKLTHISTYYEHFMWNIDIDCS